MISKLLILLLVASLVPLPVYAHVTAVNNSIEIMMHIDPGDAPSADQPTFFSVHYFDTNNKFRIQNCNCTYTIEPNFTAGFAAQKISNLKQTSNNLAIFESNFESAGSYKITFAGQPKVETLTSDIFPNFQISFDFYVDGTAPTATKNSNLVYYSIALFVILIIFYLGWIALDVFKNRNL